MFHNTKLFINNRTDLCTASWKVFWKTSSSEGIVKVFCMNDQERDLRDLNNALLCGRIVSMDEIRSRISANDDFHGSTLHDFRRPGKGRGSEKMRRLLPPVASI